jgi:Protein of unknown function (DUF2628)
MAIYTVHLPADATTAEDVAEKAVFVKEGFSFPGFIFTALWLLTKQLWRSSLASRAMNGCAANLRAAGLPMQARSADQALRNASVVSSRTGLLRRPLLPLLPFRAR